MKVVQLACWCAALIIVVITVAVLVFEMNDEPGHALPAGVSIDQVFSRADSSPSVLGHLDADERSVLAKVCVERDTERLMALFADVMRDSPAFRQPPPLVRELGFPFQFAMVVAALCAESAAAATSGAPPRAPLLKLLIKLKELGYGENEETPLRAVVAALHGGSAFPRAVFLDLGCGRGKMLAVACSQLADTGEYLFDECIGIEGVPERLRVAALLHARFQQALVDGGAASVLIVQTQQPI